MRHENDIEVKRTIDEVWAVMTNAFLVPRWAVTTLGIRLTSHSPTGAGTTGQMRSTLVGLEWHGMGPAPHRNACPGQRGHRTVRHPSRDA